jgi:aldehyde dehydrogenase (NAD+)
LSPFPSIVAYYQPQYIPAKSGQYWTVRNPTDDSIVTEDVHCAGEEDVNDAVASAKSAFEGSWGKMASSERQKIMLKLADLLDLEYPALMKLESIAMGQPTAFGAHIGTLMGPIVRYYAGWCDKLPGEMQPEDGDGRFKLVRYQPLGVCAGIAAWNATLVFLCMKSMPAIAAGNTFIFKSSEKSPLGSLAFGELVKKAGFPPGVINIISGPGSTGGLLASHMGIKKISYTGSVNAGRKVQVAATNSNLKRVTLELGGKSPSIIFSDADLENALENSSQNFLLNSGQVCVAATRIIVHEDIAEKFATGLKARFEMFKNTMGDPLAKETFLGPLADKAQTERVRAFFEQGKKDGVNFLTGGKINGNFVEPTIMKSPPLESSVWKEEIFGPALGIQTFRSEDEAIRLANDTNYGLSACVYTSDIARALRVSGRIESGTVAINSNFFPSVTIPFGGWKESGNGGREGGYAAVKSYLEAKTITVNMDVGPR